MSPLEPMPVQSLSLPLSEKLTPAKPEVKTLPIPKANTDQKTEKTDKDFQKWQEFGFPKEAYHQHPDFVDFIFKNNLHYMIEYYQKNDFNLHHKILFDCIIFKDQSPSILFKGTYTTWTEVKAAIEKEKQVDAQGNLIKGFDENGKLKGWFYTYENGLVEWDPNVWGTSANVEPKPIRQLPPEKCPANPVFTLCTAFKNYPQGPYKESHSYIEITTTDGKVYNFGLWSPELLDNGGAKTAFTTALGNMTCPDCFEFMGKRVTITKTDFDIDEAKFQKLMGWLKDKKEEGVPFNWHETNCSKFALDAAEVIGVHIDTLKTPITLFTPKKVQDIASKVWKHIPRCVRAILSTVGKILCIVPNIFINTLRCLFFGAAKGIEKTVTDKNGVKKKVKIAVISSVKDFFFKGLEGRLPRTLLEYQKEMNKLKAGKCSPLFAQRSRLQLHPVSSAQFAAKAA